ncbi:unnamed protein product [Eruca vesicaria subsp. sativa]|uniref:Transposase MuDR plant domain-containing protein n=1 Tax=Eruca vesicaria subsp. sativa TaxID=29727 RepID=A0ABC8LMK8_ERUVS|nr:unnamed protein product [Eruca vesicaria subsp. sativa]
MTGEDDKARVSPSNYPPTNDASESIQRKKIKWDHQPMACLNNTAKNQDELVIGRAIVINDAEASLRHKLTQRSTQEEIQRSTGTVVITRGKYRLPNAPPDGEYPLYLHISAASHLKETTERILAVDRAATMIEEMMKQKTSSQVGAVGFHTNKDSMSNYVCIYFKWQGRMYSIVMKAAMEEIALSMLEARICKKVGLDESSVKLKLSYIPLLVGCEEQCAISDDEDLYVYLTSTDNENRRCLLHVEVINVSELPEQLSRACEGSSLGMNYDELNSKDDETGAKAFTQYVGIEQVEEQIEADENEYVDMCDKLVELPPVSEANQFMEETWEDGMDMAIQQEFPNKKAVQEVVSMAACSNGFGFDVKKSDKARLVLKCPKEGCNWGLRASKIGKTEMFSIRRYTKMHTCSRDGQSKNNLKRKVTPQIVVSLLHEAYPGQMQTPTPKSIIDLVSTKLGVKISYSTALRGKNLYSALEDETTMLKNDACDEAIERVEL